MKLYNFRSYVTSNPGNTIQDSEEARHLFRLADFNHDYILDPIEFHSVFLDFDINSMYEINCTTLNYSRLYLSFFPYNAMQLQSTYKYHISIGFHFIRTCTTFVLQSLGLYRCWWTFSPRWYHPSCSQCIGIALFIRYIITEIYGSL
jgi:hypothetical protein